MATINFKVRPGKHFKSSIYLIFSYGRKNELRYSTGWRVNDVKNWNEDKQQVKNVIAEPEASTINQAIKELALYFEKKYNSLKTSRILINNNVLRNELDLYLGKKSQKVTPTSFKNLLECYEWYYEYYSKNPLPSTKRPLSIGTVRSFRSSYNIIKEYSDNMYALNYDRITLEFYSDFVEFLQKKNYSRNYISNHIKNLKTIMNYAWEKKFHATIDFKSRAFAKLSEDVDSIYLNESELEKIEKLNLKGRMDNARDLFLIGANTGLRVSDFNRLTKNHIKKTGKQMYFEIKTQKTGNIISIPIRETVNKILKKRDGHPPKTMPAQNINNLLKKIGEKAKLDEPIEIEKTIGGELKRIQKKKYELITNHTARRSFCTNAYLAGLSTLDIMAISGHKTEKSFYKYIKVSNHERMKKIAKHPFFK